MLQLDLNKVHKWQGRINKMLFNAKMFQLLGYGHTYNIKSNNYTKPNSSEILHGKTELGCGNEQKGYTY